MASPVFNLNLGPNLRARALTTVQEEYCRAINQPGRTKADNMIRWAFLQLEDFSGDRKILEKKTHSKEGLEDLVFLALHSSVQKIAEKSLKKAQEHIRLIKADIQRLQVPGDKSCEVSREERLKDLLKRITFYQGAVHIFTLWQQDPWLVLCKEEIFPVEKV